MVQGPLYLLNFLLILLISSLEREGESEIFRTGIDHFWINS